MKIYTNCLLLLLALSILVQAQQATSPSPSAAGTKDGQSPSATMQKEEELGSGDVLRITVKSADRSDFLKKPNLH